MTGYDERFAIMDKMGVDVQLVMPPPPQCYHTSRSNTRCRRADDNDGVAEFVSSIRTASSGRHGADAGRQQAAKELERCMTKPSSRASRSSPMLPAGSCQILLSRRSGKKPKSWVRLSSSIRTLPKAAACHAFTSTTIGNPFETTLALHYLIFDGVLERHPKLKVSPCTAAAISAPIPDASTTPGARSVPCRAACRRQLPQAGLLLQSFSPPHS
jgi:aminocarboxymuconate-semialdehyde decarboxylase